jgi:hypothetical protein
MGSGAVGVAASLSPIAMCNAIVGTDGWRGNADVVR